MEKVFLTLYVFIIAFILLSMVGGCAFDDFYYKSRKFFLVGVTMLIVTGVINFLLIIWGNG